MRFVCDACQDITNIEADRMEIQGDKLMVYSRGRLVYVADLGQIMLAKLTPEEIKAPFTENTMINLAAQTLGVEPSRLRELAEADKDGRVVVLPPEERTLDFPEKYTEIRALYHFCVDLGIKCTIEHLYDGYAVRFPDGSDFAQHHGTYGGTEGCVEPAIGDSEFDYTAVGLNLAKELVKKHKGKLEANHA
jgi:hypothetical protein